MDLEQRARRIEWVLMDSDGVLTDGRIWMSSDGEEQRSFHVRDGHGIRMGQRGGLSFGIISGRESKVVSQRAEELDIEEVHQRIYDKLGRYDEILARLGLDDAAVCYIGDDLVDLPVLRRVGLAAAPADADADVLAACHWVSSHAGGHGAVRELIELLLRSRGTWPAVTERYFSTPAR